MEKLWLCAVVFFLTAPIAFAAQTQSTTRQTTTTVSNDTLGWELGIQGGEVFPNDDKRIDDTAFANARLTYDFTPNVAAGVEGGWMRFKDEFGGQKYGHINGFPAMADLVLKLPLDVGATKVTPYILGGAGAVFWNYRESSFARNSGIKVDNDTHFASRAGAGIDFGLTQQVAFFVEGSYLFTKYEPDVNGPGAAAGVGNKIDGNSAFAGGGIKFKI